MCCFFSSPPPASGYSKERKKERKEYFLCASGVYMLCMCVFEKNKRREPGSAYQWELSPTAKMKKNYSNEIASVQLLFPGSKPNNLPETERLSEHMIKPWSGYLLVGWGRTLECYTLNWLNTFRDN